MSIVLATMVFVGWTGTSPANAAGGQSVLYVRADAAGAGDGTSWTNAFADLQDALAVAVAGDEIWVAAGTYTPGAPGDRTATFELRSGVGIYGGFAGTEVSRDERDPTAHQTILSGDLLGDDVEVSEPQELAQQPTRSDNCYHVVDGSGADETGLLDGFVITGGQADGAADAGGGGMINIWQAATQGRTGMVGPFPASPSVFNCIIEWNIARRGGGGFFNSGGSPNLIHCTIRDNHAVGSGDPATGGGGMHNLNANIVVTGCAFSGNTTGGRGAGMYNSGGVQTITECLFEKNVTFLSPNDDTRVGGGMITGWGSETEIRACVFAENRAANGGGVFNGIGGNMTIAHSLFYRNHATQPHSVFRQRGDGGGLQNYGGSSIMVNCTFAENTAIKSTGAGVSLQNGSDTTVTNCIFWANVAADRTDSSAQIGGPDPILLTYSCVQGGFPGEGNIDTNPCFARLGYWADLNDPNLVVEPDDPNAVWIEGDYHLKSATGRWDSESQSWVLDDVTSPCIDRGDPTSPVGEEPDPDGGIINMGAYGGTPEASVSLGTLPPLVPLRLVAHWKLDETEGIIAEDSAGDNDGTLHGDPLWRPDGGRVDGALALDGAGDYLETGFILNPKTEPLELSVWVKGGAPGQAIVSQVGVNGFGTTWLGTDAASGALTTGLIFGNLPLTSDAVITDGQWHEVGVSWDGSLRQLFVDGATVAEDQTALYVAFASCEGGLNIGCGPALEPGSFFFGLIDDIRLYKPVVERRRVVTGRRKKNETL